ncbi:MAG: hypothetical protein JNL77_01075 [Nitrosomonas sp.]|nr:hypothetical protein [Nitrosomonas sp.]
MRAQTYLTAGVSVKKLSVFRDDHFYSIHLFAGLITDMESPIVVEAIRLSCDAYDDCIPVHA